MSADFPGSISEFEVRRVVVITGESGSGKTTLLNVISGLDSYEEGELYIEGKETSHYLASDFEENVPFLKSLSAIFFSILIL